MNPEEHKKRHEELHVSLDELTADFLGHTKARLSEASIMDLIQWSHGQTVNPTTS